MTSTVSTALAESRPASRRPRPAASPVTKAEYYYDYAGDDPIDNVDPSGMCWTGLCWASHAYDASTRYLETHRWARCALFAASAATVAGSYGLAAREAVNAARSGEELGGIIREVATGTSTKVGTAGGIGVIASQLTGGCLP